MRNAFPLELRALCFHYGDVRTILHALMDTGDVDREPGDTHKGRRVWRYFRRSALEGPIADLQRAFDETEGMT